MYSQQDYQSVMVIGPIKAGSQNVVMKNRREGVENAGKRNSAC
jgi:hypothetical protein